MCEKIPRILCIDADCLMHIPQLQFRGGLGSIDVLVSRLLGKKWKYYATLTKLSHIWRDHGPTVFHIWSRLFGLPEAHTHARKLLPRCIAGRWGTVSATEDHLTGCGGFFRIVPVFKELCSLRAAKDAKETEGHGDVGDGGDGAAVDDITQAAAVAALTEASVHETKQYHKLMGRWSREMISVLVERSFWVVLEIHRRVTTPLNHHMHYMKVKRSGLPLAIQGNHIAGFVRGKAAQIKAEFDSLFSANWDDVFEFNDDGGEACIGPHELCAVIVQLSAYEALSYDRRIVSYLDKWPPYF